MIKPTICDKDFLNAQNRGHSAIHISLTDVLYDVCIAKCTISNKISFAFLIVSGNVLSRAKLRAKGSDMIIFLFAKAHYVLWLKHQSF